VKVLVTGGTGFVGCHSVQALLDAGHDVRMLVRAPDRIAPALDPLGVRPPEHVVGDVTDAEAVRRGLDGCDAVLHAANVFSLDVREATRMQRDNRRGTEVVLTTAQELGLDPIVHVSSFVALLPSEGSLGPDSPLGDPDAPYARSKVESERVAQDLQAAGAPVVITRPGMVWGPHDPHLGETAILARDILRGRVPTLVPGGVPVVDVRDVAAVHAAVMEPGRGPRRYLAMGEYVPVPRLFALLRAATGRRLPAAPAAPARVMLAGGAAADAAQRILPFRLPLHREGPWTMINSRPGDDSRTREELGVTFRPPSEAIADTVRWLHETGHISARQAGRAAAGAERAA
jgi:nucleoside-diphosphate-sugar epimerase